MSIKYFNPEIHHRQSYRLNNWNYTSSAYYFITICIKTRQLFCFGDIINNKLILNDIGYIIKQCWLNIPDHFNNAYLDAFIVMPNHVHGIIRIINNKNTIRRNVVCGRDVACNVPTDKKMSQISPASQSLSVMIRSFKSACTKILKQQNKIFVSFWQPRFHDHIIRNEIELNFIRQYIKNNPKNWDKDGNNKINYLEIDF